MTVIFRAIHDELNMDRGTVEGITFTELLYADDTAVITKNVSAMNRLLAKIEVHAAYYGLSFNKTKCVSMTFNVGEGARTKPAFVDGTKVPTESETVYLGATISKTHDYKKEVANKIASCFAVLNKLNVFWSKSSCPRRFKLVVLDAVVRSKLVYGLEVTHLPKFLTQKLDVFQLKGLRKILKLQTTFVDRSNSNKKVFEMCNKIKKTQNEPGKDIVPFSYYVQRRQQSLYKHIVRLDNSDPLRETALEPNTARPVHIMNLRPGRPRDKWAEQVAMDTFVENQFGEKTQFKQDKAASCSKLLTPILDRTV